MTHHTRDEWIHEANLKRMEAHRAQRDGDRARRDSLLLEAAHRYRMAGLFGMAGWCARWIGK